MWDLLIFSYGREFAKLTVHVQDHDFCARRGEVRVAGHANSPCVQYVTSNAGQREAIDCRAIRSVLKGFVYKYVVQVPGYIRWRPTCWNII